MHLEEMSIVVEIGPPLEDTQILTEADCEMCAHSTWKSSTYRFPDSRRLHFPERYRYCMVSGRLTCDSLIVSEFLDIIIQIGGFKGSIDKIRIVYKDKVRSWTLESIDGHGVPAEWDGYGFDAGMAAYRNREQDTTDVSSSRSALLG